MKLKLIFTLILINAAVAVHAQNCDIQIQILEDKYMFGQAEKMENSEEVKKLTVNFDKDFMEVVMPVEGQNYLIKVINQDCQAYCTRAKRVRQLHSGDEKIVRNLFKQKQDDILSQIKECQL